MTRIKICGVTREDDARAIALHGVDFLGLNRWPRSKRYVELDRAIAIAAAARAAGPIAIVGVFVDAGVDEIADTHAAIGLDAIQLHGAEPDSLIAALRERAPVPIWRAIAADQELARVPALAAPADVVLLDAPGATVRHAIGGAGGATFDHARAAAVRALLPTTRLAIAGGLDAASVAGAIAAARPWAVDVAGGVEAAPGVKDAAKIAAFVSAVRASMLREEA